MENPIDYWPFIVKYLPNYYSRNDVLHSDIFCKFVNNEEISKEDVIWISEQCNVKDVWKSFLELDKKLMCEAMGCVF